jgi:small subunit ribosomal protein S21
MAGVKVRDDESFEKALKRFTKTCEKAGILSDIKKHQLPSRKPVAQD